MRKLLAKMFNAHKKPYHMRDGIEDFAVGIYYHKIVTWFRNLNIGKEFQGMADIVMITLMAIYSIAFILAVFMVLTKDKRSRSGKHS
jgi:hypothetical protein